MTGVPADAFHAHIEGELAAELARIHGDCTRIDSEASSKGMFRSGRRLLLLSDAYVQGIQRHRRAVFDLWVTYIKPHMSGINAAACRTMALAALDKSLKAATADHDGRITKEAASLQQAQSSLLESFLAKTAQERRALESQTELHAALPLPPLAQQIVVNATGRNNNVNVGAGSAHQTVHEGVELAALVQALGQLLAELGAQRADADLTALVVDAKAEAEAPRPNRLKLASLLNGAATGVQVLGSAPAAWELVKAAGKALGLM